ncbi:MAG: shikimate dehydrogenase [Chloroflexota bacterium]
MIISGKTRVCGIIGDPVGHSMSPAMHNAAFRELGLDYVYVPFRVGGEALGGAIGGMRALGIRGLNVTIPHKVAVLPFLDALDPLAQRIGAVNTIVNDNGTLTGYNTDAAGFMQALLAGGIEPEGRNVVVLGAGGAARAVSFALAERGARLTILNRHVDKATALAGRISRDYPGAAARRLDDENLSAALAGADILVNATSSGMSPGAGDTPVPAGRLRDGIIVCDIVYNPLRTRLLREAEAAGARVIGGMDMLAWQGALAFEKWTERKAPLELMKGEAIEALGL